MLKFPLISLKNQSIALLFTSFLRKTGKITLFFISPYSRAKVSDEIHMNSNDPYRNWPHAVLIAIDQLGNALAGGHPVTTISARVGYFSENAQRGMFYWRWLEYLIDVAFYPVDGPNHCYKAWKSDTFQLYRIGSDVTRIILSLIILVINPFIALFLRIAVIIYPKWRFTE